MRKILFAVALLLIPLTTTLPLEAEARDADFYGVQLVPAGDVYVEGYYR